MIALRAIGGVRAQRRGAGVAAGERDGVAGGVGLLLGAVALAAAVDPSRGTLLLVPALAAPFVLWR